MLIYLIIDINNIHIIIYWPLAHPPRPLFCCILFMHIIPLFGQPQVGIPGLGAASDPAEAVEEAEAGGADANDEAAPGQGHDDEAAPAIVASADVLPATDGRSPQSLLTPRDIVTPSSGGDGIAATATTTATTTVSDAI